MKLESVLHNENYEAILQLVSLEDTQLQILKEKTPFTSFSSCRYCGDMPPVHICLTNQLITDVFVCDSGHQRNAESARCGLNLRMVNIAKKTEESFTITVS